MQKRLYKDQDHAWLAETFHSLGEALEGLKKPTEAVVYYQQALCMAFRVYQQEHPHTTQYMNSLLANLGKLEDAKIIQQSKTEVLPLWKKYLGKEHTLKKQLRELGQDSSKAMQSSESQP